MIKDQWVPCNSAWRDKFPGACADAPTRPARRGADGADHYHLRDNPSVQKLAEFTRVPLPNVRPQSFGGSS